MKIVRQNNMEYRQQDDANAKNIHAQTVQDNFSSHQPLVVLYVLFLIFLPVLK